jgi:hypothetical protein
MKKPTSKIREELARLQEQLKQAETRDAERIGRIALKAGLGEIEIDDADLQAAFEDVAKRFRGTKAGSNGKEKSDRSSDRNIAATSVSAWRGCEQAVARLERMQRHDHIRRPQEGHSREDRVGRPDRQGRAALRKRALLLGALIEAAKAPQGR